MAVRRATGRGPTMVETAPLAGVSKPTVSGMPNGKHEVAAATRERVASVVTESAHSPGALTLPQHRRTKGL